MYSNIIERLENLVNMSSKEFRNTIPELANCPPNRNSAELIEAEKEQVRKEIEFLRDMLSKLC